MQAPVKRIVQKQGYNVSYPAVQTLSVTSRTATIYSGQHSNMYDHNYRVLVYRTASNLYNVAVVNQDYTLTQLGTIPTTYSYVWLQYYNNVLYIVYENESGYVSLKYYNGSSLSSQITYSSATSWRGGVIGLSDSNLVFFGRTDSVSHTIALFSISQSSITKLAETSSTYNYLVPVYSDANYVYFTKGTNGGYVYQVSYFSGSIQVVNINTMYYPMVGSGKKTLYCPATNDVMQVRYIRDIDATSDSGICFMPYTASYNLRCYVAENCVYYLANDYLYVFPIATTNTYEAQFQPKRYYLGLQTFQYPLWNKHVIIDNYFVLVSSSGYIYFIEIPPVDEEYYEIEMIINYVPNPQVTSQIGNTRKIYIPPTTITLSI